MAFLWYNKKAMGDRSLRFLVALVLGSLFLLGPGADSAPTTVLIRVDKAGLAGLPVLLVTQIFAHVELADAWLASVPIAVAGRLKARGIGVEILEPRTPGRDYFLAYVPEGADMSGLAAFGRVRRIADGIALFWTENGREAREVLPVEIAIERLSFDAVRDVRTAAEANLPARIMGRLLRPPAYDARIAAAAAQISSSSLTADILALQSFQTRYASYPGCEQAGDYLYAYFSSLGLKTEADPFTFSSPSRSTRNIVATLPGRASPEYVVILCAHYDSTTGSVTGPTSAPGADDNASGTAALMEIARVLAGRSFDFTVKFVCFSAEEWGLYGSKHYSQEAKTAGERILGVVNLDMIACSDARPEDLDVFANSASEWLANRFVLCARQYGGILLTAAVNPNVRASDHSPFWDQGYAALLAIEDYPVKSPYYHKTTDVLATLDMDFATAVTKTALAVAAGLAQPSLQ
jgi:hypothetical protein